MSVRQRVVARGLGVRIASLLTAAAVAASLTSACVPDETAEPRAVPDGGEGLPGRIVSVTDGDTVVIDFGASGTERVRLLGIDTPETVRPNSPVECWGPEASARTEELLPAGTEVLGQRDVDARDRYGRLLLYLWRADDGLFVNRQLLVEGHATVLAIAPNNARRADLSAASADARRAGRGLWGACDLDD